MAVNYKNPPVLGTDTIYETWKNELEVWSLMTDIEDDKQALAVTLSLTGQARAKALEIDVKNLNKSGGLKILIKALDSLFQQDSVDLAYSSYTQFDTYRRTEGISMNDFIIEYERRNNLCKRYNLDFPDPILAFKLLDSASLSQTERQLVLTAACDRSYKTIKSALKRIFGDSLSTNDRQECGISVKQESAYVPQNYERRNQKYTSRGRYQPNNQRGTNPLDRFGRRTRCAICQSVFHWVKDCPHKTEDDNTKLNSNDKAEKVEEKCNLTLFTNSKQETENEILMAEAYGCAVIDTACTRTVCGKRWFDHFVENLDDSRRKEVTTSSSDKIFKFGDGAQINSFMNATIPAIMGETCCKIETEIVDVDIPLLLSKSSLKKAETILNLTNDEAIMFQKPVKLDLTSSGHYCIDIMDGDEPSVEKREDHVLLIDDKICKLSEQDKKQTLIKLHKQFGHASSDHLKKLLKNAGVQDPDIFSLIDEITDQCDVCLKHRKQAPKPAVGFPLALDFNQTVAVDLHQLEPGLWYLHIIDEFTRFSAGAIINSKEPKTFVQNFLSKWISIHGAPRRLYCDNGGEFNNSQVHDMCENFNIEVKTTAAYSPWSNGLLERHNQTLTVILKKIKMEQNCDWETAMSWALSAKNTMINVHGYSAHQLVYGRNPNLPSNLTDNPPALEGSTSSQTVGEHINTLHAMRREFVKAESSERIRRALRKQIRPESGPYKMGDKVYYKRPDSLEWRGPGIVIGQDGPVVFVRHGGTLVRVHKCRLRLTGDDSIERPEQTRDYQETPRQQTQKENNSPEHEDEENDNIVPRTLTHDQQTVDTSKLKPGQVVTYQHMDTGDRLSAKILSRAGRATGRNKHWYNVEYVNPDQMGIQQSIDLSQIQHLTTETCERDEENFEEDVLMTDNISWEEAKVAEMANWKNNGVYEEVVDEGQRKISTRWICSVKETDDGMVPKARLVARGFEEMDTDIPRDSPTCSSESIKLILAITAQNKWKLHSMDIKTAFLQGQPIGRDLFVQPPTEAKCHGKLWHLKKCVYGLGDASRQWYNKVKDVMIDLSGKPSCLDPAVFRWYDTNGTLMGILASHVDDFIWSGTKGYESTIIEAIRSQFNIGREDSQTFQYLGMELLEVEEQIHLHQNKYAENLKFVKMEKNRALERDSSLTDKEKEIFRSKVGQILWIARQSCPDVMYEACRLSGCYKNAKVENLFDVNKVIKQIKAENVTLKFQDLGEGKLSLLVYSDASFGNLPDGGSQGAHIIFVMNSNSGKVSPLCWNSKKIRRVVRSTLAAETLAMADGIDMGIFLSSLYTEIITGQTEEMLLPLVCVTDCKSLHDNLNTTKLATEKRLRMEISAIRETVQSGKVKEIRWVETQKQLADCLTKKGATSIKLLQVLENGQL